MTKVKYVQKRVSNRGAVVWAFNPPAYVREAISDQEIVYTQFEDRLDAEAHAKSVSDMYFEAKRQEKKSKHLPLGTVMSLVSNYKKTNAWSSLSDNSKRTYNQLFKGVFEVRLGQSNKNFGEMNAFNVSPMNAEGVYEFLKTNISQHRANHTVKVLRRVWQVCKKKNLIRSNPWSDMGLRATPERIILWEPDQVTNLISHADRSDYWCIGSLVLLCYHLCQRPGDMRQLRWADFKDGTFDFVQEKTKVRVTIPASPQLIERLEPHRGPDDQVICMSQRTGKGYDRYACYKVFGRLRKAANIPTHLQLRDLRRTGATEMAENGVTEDQLRSVTGHKGRGCLNTYVRPTKKLAETAMQRRFG